MMVVATEQLNVKFVAEGDMTSSLQTHARTDTWLPLCGQIIHSEIRGRGWWYDFRTKEWKWMVLIPFDGPVTCAKCIAKLARS